MHTIQLNIDDSVFDKFMGLLDILPKDKIKVTSDETFPTISFEDAQEKVKKSINNISSNKSIPLEEAINKVLQS